MNLIPLLNKPYRDGVDDCYGLAREYYEEEYGLSFRNYARPIGFDEAGIPLLDQYFGAEGFVTINPTSIINLERGDGLLFNLFKSKTANHVGVYIGNGYFIHHLYQKVSTCDRLDARWYNRISRTLRHPDITAQNESRMTKMSILEALPPHLRGQQDGTNP